MNANKCECITFSVKQLKPIHPTLYLNDIPLREVDSHTHPGLTLSNSPGGIIFLKSIKKQVNR
jgi:hypothetical protein